MKIYEKTIDKLIEMWEKYPAELERGLRSNYYENF